MKEMNEKIRESINLLEVSIGMTFLVVETDEMSNSLQSDIEHTSL